MSPKSIGQCLEMFLTVTPEKRGATGIYLVDRGQGCSQTSYKAQDSLITKNYPAPNVTNDMVEKP